jgi:L-aminopeptidase/D-esterase-like protein
MLNLITDVPGLEVGNAGDAGERSGVTVILPRGRAVCGVDSRGGAPGTRETDALDPTCLVDAVDAVVLSGGSVYGLDAASGVTAWLGARDRGFRLAEGVPASPVVPAAILFDLANGGDKSWGLDPPYRRLGIEACEAAGIEFGLGNVGAGLGAVAGSLKGGLGSASATLPGGATVGALVAVNAFGSVIAPGSGAFWAAPYEQGAEFGGLGPATLDPGADIWAGTKRDAGATAPGANTTIGVVATDVALTPAEARRLAIMAQDGLARAIRPVHTPLDGDTLFALSTAARPLREPRPTVLAELGAVAADTVARAVARAVWAAETVGGIVSWRDRHGG